MVPDVSMLFHIPRALHVMGRLVGMISIFRILEPHEAAKLKPVLAPI